MDVVVNQYPYVVVDAGRGLGEGIEPLFQLADTIYLVTQLSISSMRNTQRFISHIQHEGDRNIELVVNRFDPRKTEFDDERVAKALGLQPKWKVPNDLRRRAPFFQRRQPLSSWKSRRWPDTLRTMARAAAGPPRSRGKKERAGACSPEMRTCTEWIAKVSIK